MKKKCAGKEKNEKKNAGREAREKISKVFSFFCPSTEFVYFFFF